MKSLNMGSNLSYAKHGCSKPQSFGSSQDQQIEMSETHSTNMLPGIIRTETSEGYYKN